MSSQLNCSAIENTWNIWLEVQNRDEAAALTNLSILDERGENLQLCSRTSEISSCAREQDKDYILITNTFHLAKFLRKDTSRLWYTMPWNYSRVLQKVPVRASTLKHSYRTLLRRAYYSWAKQQASSFSWQWNSQAGAYVGFLTADRSRIEFKKSRRISSFDFKSNCMPSVVHGFSDSLTHERCTLVIQ